jgi:hypothetical protein|tara:strand:+ start:1095 stop:1337 length:243 start_codon:yes stop_codon:yes gene_type:complete
VSDTYKIVYGKVIGQAIKDLVCNHQHDREAAVKYLKSEAFIDHCQMAGYPDELRDALDEMLSLSRPQQKVVAQLVMEKLA